MKQRKQDYITIGSDGAVVSPDAAARKPEAPDAAADVVYRLSRMAAEAADALSVAQNAHEAAAVSVYTEV